MKCSSPFAFAACLTLGVAAFGCAPTGGVGDDCDDAPCAPGLICTDEFVCAEPPPPPPPPCEDELDCALDGDTSGRVCTDGVCGFADCAFDAQCGTRICVDGQCAPNVPCIRDTDCDDGALCVDNSCRPPCQSDDDCGVSVGGFGLNACVDGECLQRCFGDATCFGGGLCDNNVCIEPECEDAADCDGDNVLCDGGRCASFTPCQNDEGCFDPNLRCDLEVEPARCVERPTCRSDAACGVTGICLDEHCRDAEGCFVDDDCSRDTDECVGGRCVRAPACRAASDCDDSDVCVNLRCEARAGVSPARLELGDGAGLCVAGCTRVLVVGEALSLLAQGYDDDGAPVDVDVLATSADANVTAGSSRNAISVDAPAVGNATVNVVAGDVGIDIDVRVVDAAASGELVVIVSDAGNAVPVGAVVRVGDDSAVVDDNGVARFAVAAGEAIVARAADGRGVIVIGVPDVSAGAVVRLRLPRSTNTIDEVAGVSIAITSTGDELGPVGLGLALPSVQSPNDLSLPRLLGDVVSADLEVPIIGAIPVALPAAMSLAATLQLGGQQVLRENAEVVVGAGPAFALAIEARREQDVVIGLALGGDPLAFAFDLIGDAETADNLVVALGDREARALVPDVNDRDGDGNVDEGVIDFSGEAADVRPAQLPLERGALSASLPAGAQRALILAGFALPGRLVPSGVSVLRESTNFEGVPLPESYRSVAASTGLGAAQRFTAVIASFVDDENSSRAFVRSDGLLTSAPLGTLLAPPEGTTTLPDVPAVGDLAIFVPDDEGADLVRIRGEDDGGVVDVYAISGATVLVPSGSTTGRFRPRRVELFSVGGLSALGVGAGPVDVDVVAEKAAGANVR